MPLLHNFDRKYTDSIRGLPESYRSFMSGLSFIGDPIVVIAIGFSGFISALQHHQSAIEHAFVYSIIAFGLNTVLKLLLHRRRPQGLIIRTLGLQSYSFPSGHAFGTVIFYGLFAYLDLKYLSHPWNAVIASLLTALILLIGISRIYLGTHYPSDVLGGWFLGGLSLIAINLIAF